MIDATSPQPQPDRDILRASDTEREHVATQIRDHYAEGRLSTDEMQERLEKVYAARTLRQLDELTLDLPAIHHPAAVPVKATARPHRELREHVGAYVLVNLLLVVICAITGAGHFWPICPILGWGVGVASHAMGVTSRLEALHSYGTRGRIDARRARRSTVKGSTTTIRQVRPSLQPGADGRATSGICPTTQQPARVTTCDW